MDQTWSKADIHIHTTYSDGTAGVEAVLEYVATRTDLRVIAITDHDTIEGALKARRLAPAYGIEVIVGEEVSTAEGHLLALFIERPLAPKQPAATTIAAVHAAPPSDDRPGLHAVPRPHRRRFALRHPHPRDPPWRRFLALDAQCRVYRPLAARPRRAALSLSAS